MSNLYPRNNLGTSVSKNGVQVDSDKTPSPALKYGISQTFHGCCGKN